FADTFDLIHGQYKLNRNEAFGITLRVHRGGGFTKDRLYLSGLRKIYRKFQKGESLDLLLSGKVAIEDEPIINYFMEQGLAHPITHRTAAFAKNQNTNTTLDFILNNLK
ncbi:MAG: tyrosine/phenylalanine carboxypeptidase domain-containing protein, partial [Bacteroidota bacterium]